jgi:adenylate cyclase
MRRTATTADLDLLEHLVQLGASDAQVAGRSDAELIGLAGDLQLADGLDYDAVDLAREVGCSVEEVRSVYERLGLRVEELAGFGDGDVAFASLIVNDTSGIVDQVSTPLLRVAGTLLGRLADAVVAAYVQDVQTRIDEANDLVAMAEQNAVASMLAMRLADGLPAVFIQHMWMAVRRQRQAQAGVLAPEIVRMAVGFVDLVGFTKHAGSVGPATLIATIESFERRAFEAASRHGGRIIKSIGDEVMIAASDASATAAIALELISSTGDDPSIAPRGGVSAGDVLFRLGDYYGPVVNLASRLATEAVPGEVLTDQDTLAGHGLAVQPAGRRALKGFSEPVAVWSVHSAS